MVIELSLQSCNGCRVVVIELLWLQSCCGVAMVIELLLQSCYGYRVVVIELLWLQSCCYRVVVIELLLLWSCRYGYRVIVIVPASLPSRGGDVAAYVFNISQPSLPTPFYSVPVSVSVFMALSTVFHSINSPDNSPLSDSVLPVSSFLPYWSFQLYISL